MTIEKVNLRAEADKLGREAVEVQALKTDIRLRTLMTWFLVSSYTIVNLATVVLFFLNGFGVTDLSDAALMSLLGGTVAELAGIVLIIARYLFPKG